VAEGLDLPALASAFGRALHDAGVPSTPERAVRFARALALAPPAERSRLYWTARAVFVSHREQLPVFDAVFAMVFDGIADPAELRGDPNAPPLQDERDAAPAAGTGKGPPPQAGLERDEEDLHERDVPVAAASAEERLAERDFAELDAEELLALRRLMRELALAPPPRRTRRARRDRRGERLDVRATLRASHRTGGDPARRVMRRRAHEPRRLVVLCDVSASMEPYTRAFLQLLHAAVGGADAEAFVFATRLTRLTRALRARHPDVAIERAAATASDWSSGTRIGAALREFNDTYGRRGMARGAVVVIVSDGWERGDPEVVAEQMRRLRRLAHRVVWVNPRRASPRFEPLVGGMAAALPSCDAFVSGHSMRALREVAAAIAGHDIGRSAR
jgi:uncharacterized protein with von Willebrand factor type A (vWA) domain